MKKYSLKKIGMGIVLSAMLITMAACSKKQPIEPKEVTEVVETEQMQISADETVTIIQNEPTAFDKLVRNIQPFIVESLELTYGADTLIIERNKESLEDLAEETLGKKVTITPYDFTIEPFNEQQVPNVYVSFSEVGTQELQIVVNSKDDNGEQVEAEISIQVTVVPEIVKEAGDITQNRKLAEEIENFNFEQFIQIAEESNIAEVATDASAVEFGKVGTYTVIYTVYLKEPIEVLRETTTDTDMTENSEQKDEQENPEETLLEQEVDIVTEIEVPVEVTIVDKETQIILEEENVSVIDNQTEEMQEEVEAEEENVLTENIETESNGTPDNTNTATPAPNTSTSPNNQGSNGNTTNTSNTGNTNTNTSPTTPNKTWVEPVYERKWVVTKAAWTESKPVYENRGVARCLVCGAENTTETAISNHAYQHALKGEAGNYTVENKSVQVGTETINHPEVGHWEDVLVKDGYWK
jgi:hypothetical protein